eukprot:334857-Chlamydomonas_euryale.AAC.1
MEGVKCVSMGIVEHGTRAAREGRTAACRSALQYQANHLLYGPLNRKQHNSMFLGEAAFNWTGGGWLRGVPGAGVRAASPRMSNDVSAHATRGLLRPKEDAARNKQNKEAALSSVMLVLWSRSLLGLGRYHFQEEPWPLPFSGRA